MSKRLPDLHSSGIGNLDDILHNQSVSDLSWLSVNEDDYRASEALPKQNLDIIPELQNALRHDGDERVPSLIPLRPHTIVNENPLDKPGAGLRTSADLIRNRVAKYLMAGVKTKEIANKLRSEFSTEDMVAASESVRPVLDEAGLLGNVYVDSLHFPRCAQEGADRKFVATAAKRALFVLAKDECAGCVHNRDGACASFKKRIVDEVPYTTRTLAHYAVSLSSEKRLESFRVSSSMTDGDRRQILKSSFLRTPVESRGEPVQTIQHHPKPAPVRVTASDVNSFWERRLAVSGSEEMPGPLYLKGAKQIMLGTADFPTLSSSSNPEVRKLAREYGILGHTYLDMDAMGGCRPTLDLVRSRNLSPDFVLRRASSCPMCMGTSDGACAELASVSPIVASRPEPSRTAFVSAMRRALRHGRLSDVQVASATEKAPESSNWATLTAQANLFQPEAPTETRVYDGPRESFHHGSPGGELEIATMDPEEVRRSISHMMNTGLAGRQLQAAVLSRYSRQDLAQVPEVGLQLGKEDGVQGAYFIDPTAYADYGRGCTVGAQQFRKRGAPYVLAGSSCTGCSLQTAPGWCSKYSKSLIRNVPTEVRTATRERRALQMLKPPPLVVENPVEAFQLSSELEVDLNGSKSKPVEITIAGPGVTE